MKLCLLTLLLFVNNALQAQTPSLIPFQSGDKWGYLTPGKMIAIQPVYDTALPFSHGVAEVGAGKMRLCRRPLFGQMQRYLRLC